MADEKDVTIARLRFLVRDMYADLIDNDEFCSSWPFEKYALRVDHEGIDAGHLGSWHVSKDIELYRQLERQELARGDRYSELRAQKYREKHERLIAIAHTVGMHIEEE